MYSYRLKFTNCVVFPDGLLSKCSVESSGFWLSSIRCLLSLSLCQVGWLVALADLLSDVLQRAGEPQTDGRSPPSHTAGELLITLLLSSSLHPFSLVSPRPDPYSESATQV